VCLCARGGAGYVPGAGLGGCEVVMVVCVNGWVGWSRGGGGGEGAYCVMFLSENSWGGIRCRFCTSEASWMPEAATWRVVKTP